MRPTLERMLTGSPEAASPQAPNRGLLGIAILLLGSCTGQDNSFEQGNPKLTVFAAASLAQVVPDLTGGDSIVRQSFGSSSSLARQIADGAPADLYVSANARWVDWLAQAGHLESEPIAWCSNRLVCAVRAESEWLIDGPTNLAALAEELFDGARLAIADPGVPAGDYARRSLKFAGQAAALEDFLVGQADVSAVARSVATGQVLGGFVYATDLEPFGLSELFALPAEGHGPLEYWLAIPKASQKKQAAQALVEHLRSPASSAYLEQAGFGLLPSDS